MLGDFYRIYDAFLINLILFGYHGCLMDTFIGY